MAHNASEHGPDPIDVQVGVKLRTIRRARSLSQDGVASAAGISFQQLQKYERGANRVSASMLVKLARALGCAASALLPGDDEPTPQPVDLTMMALLTGMRGVEELVKAFSRISSEDERQVVLHLARLLAKRCDKG